MADPRVLQKSPWNSNVVSPDNELKLEESIRRLGMFKPVLVRELEDGSLQIIGGEHCVDAAQRAGAKEVPIVNLGVMTDQRAKEISLVDNRRYGEDDTLQLAALLGDLGNIDELAMFIPYGDAELSAIFSSTDIALDDLDIPDDGTPKIPEPPAVRTHQIMRFKVALEDAEWVTKRFEDVMRTQGFTESDSLTNAGDALIYLLKPQSE